MGYLWIPQQALWRVHVAGFIRTNHTPWHKRIYSNPNLQLVIALGSDVRFKRSEEQLTLSTGDFLFLRPNERHTGWGPEHYTGGFYFVQFRTEPAPSWRNAPFALDSLTQHDIVSEFFALPDYGSIAADSTALNDIDRLVTEWEEQCSLYQIKVVALLQKILIHMAQTAIDKSLSKSDNRPNTARQSEVAQQTLAYLDDHYHQPFVAEQLSDHLNLSYPYISRVFRSVVGMSIVVYINRKRINHAKMLLISPGCPSISAIAETVGFTDPYYFSRVFHKIEGVSPRGFANQAYRQAAK